MQAYKNHFIGEISKCQQKISHAFVVQINPSINNNTQPYAIIKDKSKDVSILEILRDVWL